MDFLKRIYSKVEDGIPGKKNKVPKMHKINPNSIIYLFEIVCTMSGGPYNYNYIFKYIIIGDMGVGKSCLLHHFTEKKCKLN